MAGFEQATGVALQTSFRITAPATRIHAGPGTLGQVAKEAERLGARRVFLICGNSIAGSGLLDALRTSLNERFAGAFTQVGKESPLPAVEDCVEAARAAVTTRSVAILLAERRPAQELCTKYPPGQPPQSPRLLQLKLPNIVVLTTPSPAALGGGGAVRDTVQRQRLELYDPKARPAAIILDPQALATAPLGLFLNAAMATYCGTVEGFLAPALNAFAQADLVQALALSQEHLPRLLRTPDDGTVRVQLAVAGLLRNRASDALAGNGGLLLAAGLVHALQSRYAHFPQGHGIAALLAPALRYTAQVPAPGHASLATAFGLARHGAPDMAAVASASTDFLRQLGVPTRLRELDIPRDGLAAVADVALESYYVRAAPRPLTDRGEALALLEEAW